jgi:cytochrome o ubiquinol oxidase subunit 1
MGMPRRMAYYATMTWHPYLIVAAVGVGVIMLGIACQGIQLLLSIMERRSLHDATGDPWDGRTLEWMTSSPPAVYNFPKIPVVDDIDAFMEMKEQGIAYRKPDHYVDIELPKNTPHGLIIGGLSFVFGFAMIWHIWWLAIVAALGMLCSIIARSADDNIDYVIPAAEVERIENERFRELASVTK